MIRCLLPLLLCVACASAPKPEPEPVAVVFTELMLASENVGLPLNVSIQVFADEMNSVSREFRAIRAAEAAYVPIHLTNTLNRTGFWGAVNVVPKADVAAELLVTGKLIHSDALTLKLQIKVEDSRGDIWFDEVFEGRALNYDQIESSQDAFQSLYNRIANRMAEVSLLLAEQDRNRILDMAMLRYAILLSPSAFGDYLIQNEQGDIDVQGLPARNDPLYQRVARIRDRESAMQDVIDAHFNNFYQSMLGVYPYWRQLSFELLSYNQKLATTQSDKGKIEDVYRIYREAKMNEDELRELAESFEREMAPTVTELEGRVIELQGSLQNQYERWRKLLQEIYEQRTGQI